MRRGTVESGGSDVRLVDRAHKGKQSDFMSFWMTCVSSCQEAFTALYHLLSLYQRFTALLLMLTDDFAIAGNQSEEFSYSNQFRNNKSN